MGIVQNVIESVECAAILSVIAAGLIPARGSSSIVDRLKQMLRD